MFESFFATYMPNINARMLGLMWESCGQTLLMVGVPGLLCTLMGIPMGVYMRLTDRGGILENVYLNSVISFVVNVVRSVPFIVLMIWIQPLTKKLAGTTIGTEAALIPLTIAAAPFMARLVETSLREVDNGLTEAAQSMGATTWQIVRKVLLPEAMPGIVAGLTITLISLTGYSAMAGIIGGGGLGDLAVRYGHQRFQGDVMNVVVVILVIFVQLLQSAGDRLVRRINHR